MNIAYFDCFNGAAGDMILGALLDAGLPADEFRAIVDGLPIDGYALSIESTTKQGFAATRFDVQLNPDAPQPHRHLSDVRKIIDGADLAEPVRTRAIAAFERLARAEAEVHGTTIDRVHFHEVGAVDAIIDIVGACWGLTRLGIERVACAPVPVGSGTVACAHGVMPVPAPATALLLEGVPIAPTEEIGELTTPTAAAILTEWADDFGAMPGMTIRCIGTGAGHRDGTHRPNVLRVMIGEMTEAATQDRITVLEANIDDATPEVLGYAIDRLLEAGALDAYCLPIHMKKSRPAALLTVLSEPHMADAMRNIVFAETPTLGIRWFDANRTVLPRRIETVSTRFGPIRIKIGSSADRDTTVSAEFDDCSAAAKNANAPLRVVMSEAVSAWYRDNTG